MKKLPLATMLIVSLFCVSQTFAESKADIKLETKTTEIPQVADVYSFSKNPETTPSVLETSESNKVATVVIEEDVAPTEETYRRPSWSPEKGSCRGSSTYSRKEGTYTCKKEYWSDETWYYCDNSRPYHPPYRRNDPAISTNYSYHTSVV